MAQPLTDGYLEAQPGVWLHYLEQGHGPLVVLLHGFPAYSRAWHEQLPALSAAGFRAVALDMRGYYLSSKPRGVAAYKVSVLAADIAGAIDRLGAERAIVVGHDWGGEVAWTFAMQHPTRLDRLVIINAPHPATFARHLLTPSQLRKSWYMFFFQLPWLPEALMRANNFAVVRRELSEPHYVAALQQPGALTATINYYRAIFRGGLAGFRAAHRRIDAPTLVIWGTADRFLGPALAEPDRRLVPNLSIERLPGVGHWPQLEAPARVNELLLSFLDDTPG